MIMAHRTNHSENRMIGTVLSVVQAHIFHEFSPYTPLNIHHTAKGKIAHEGCEYQEDFQIRDAHESMRREKPDSRLKIQPLTRTEVPEQITVFWASASVPLNNGPWLEAMHLPLYSEEKRHAQLRGIDDVLCLPGADPCALEDFDEFYYLTPSHFS